MSRYIYIAGPLGANDAGRRARIDAAIAAGCALLAAGLRPFVPHLWAGSFDADGFLSYETWMEYDFAWIERCDALLRIPGESPGADREVQRATVLEIPVFDSVEAVIDWARRLPLAGTVCPECCRNQPGLHALNCTANAVGPFVPVMR